MKENKNLRLEEEVREDANLQEETSTTEEVEEVETNETDFDENSEESENSSKRNILIFGIVGVAVLAIVIVLCIVLANSARKNKQEEAANQQNNIGAETEEQTTIIAEEVTEVAEESTPEPTEEPTPEPTAEPVEMVSWEEWASQPEPGEEEPHLVVWNEEKGKQLIIEPDSEYTLEEGDRLAVSATMSIENLNEMSAVILIKEGEFTKQNIVRTDYGQYWEIDIQKDGKNKIYYDFKGEEYGYIVVK